MPSKEIETFEQFIQGYYERPLLATGFTQHICVDLAGHMAKIPPAILDRLLQGMKKLLQAQAAVTETVTETVEA